MNYDKNKIEAIKADMNCPKDFKCAEKDFEDICKAKDFGVDDYLECKEEKPRECWFSFPFGYGHFCKCPLRVYVAKKLKK